MAGKSWNAKSKGMVFAFSFFNKTVILSVCLFVCSVVSDLFDNYNSFISLFICTQSFPKKFDSPDNELVSQVENEVGDNC